LEEGAIEETAEEQIISQTATSFRRECVDDDIMNDKLIEIEAK
jgi:hypothetical protein